MQRGCKQLRQNVSGAALIALVAAPALAEPLTVEETFRTPPPVKFEKTKMGTAPSSSREEPVLLEATNLDYDQEKDIVVASGNVQIAQGETIILADKIIYEQATGKVTAVGNTSMLEPTGNVYFADQLELTDQMKAGVIRQFSARLADGSLFASQSARKLDENRVELDRAVYSPCKVHCDKDGSGNDPLWQIKADHVLIDQQKQKATYDNTTMEVYGWPVMYSPYFSHSLPGAPNESGFLIPEYQHSNNIGTMLKVPYYYAIGQDKDMTIAPIITSEEGAILTGEYRQKYDNGSYILNGSVTRPQERDALGARTEGHEVRGNFNAVGDFNVGTDSKAGFDVHRVTDDTYLRRYGFGSDTLLTSRIYGHTSDFAEDRSRSFARVQTVAFQGLTAQDNRNTIPMALPLADLNYESAPGMYNSRLSFDGNALMLTRETGADSRRLSSRLGWKLPYISEDGQVIEFATYLRTDLYDVSDVGLVDGTVFDGTTGRIMPEVSATWRYPVINQFSEDSSLLLEPVVSFVATPNGGNSDKIPNEDSLVPEFTDGNLFSDNRYAGWDRVETGPRVSYGLRGQAQIFSDKYIDWLIGQHYRMNDDRTFPYTNDLGDNLSDYVGKIGINYAPFSIAYRFRLDKDSYSSKRNELDATYNRGRWGMGVSYLSLQNDPILATKEVVNASGSVRVSDEWVFSAGTQRDIELNFTTANYAGLVFQNECTNITTQLARSYTRDRDIEPSTSLLLRLSLKNLE